MVTLHTIGHSTRPLDEFITVLRSHRVQMLIDIRAFPASRRLPHFNRESLEKSLPEAGLRYVWMKALGGYRQEILEQSPNIALRNASFRNYADYMMTAEFRQAAGELAEIGLESRTAYMCAERMWFQCHRMLVSDWLVAFGNTVLHIDGEEPPKAHRLNSEAHLEGDALIYGGKTLFH